MLRKIDFEIDLKTRVRDLPVSQKQMLEIAIALSKNAKVLIMDEPTAALSRKETETLFRTIADIKSRGIGIIYISHKLEEVKLIGDRITVLRDGLNVATVTAKDADLQQIISLMIGKELSRSHAVRTTVANGELLRVDGLRSRHFVAPLNFTVRKQEILGITGLVGAGKTELANVIFGVDPVQAGSITLAGRPKAEGMATGTAPRNYGAAPDEPYDSRPPLVLTGKRPPIANSPASAAGPASPRP